MSVHRRREFGPNVFSVILIAPGQREGQMIALIMSDSPTMGIHFVHLDEKHQNMIRQLSVQLAAERNV